MDDRISEILEDLDGCICVLDVVQESAHLDIDSKSLSTTLFIVYQNLTLILKRLELLADSGVLK